MEDCEILDLYWQRSDQAIRESDRKYGNYCHTIAMNICGSREDAEECVSDTWLTAWNQIPPKRPSILSAFFGAITRNGAINRLRAERRAKRGGGQTDLALSELEQCIPSAQNVEQELEGKELEAGIRSFVAGLRSNDRNIFLARYFYLTPVKEIAQRLGCSESKVKTTLYRLRIKLQTYLKEEGLC